MLHRVVLVQYIDLKTDINLIYDVTLSTLWFSSNNSFFINKDSDAVQSKVPRDEPSFSNNVYL